MQEFMLSVKVDTNASVTPEQVAKILQRLIDTGLEDAAATIAAGDGDVTAAELATELNIHAPKIATTPRVLVVVNGGVADPVVEGNVDVEVFDWDNYNEDPAGTGGVSEEFASLAKPCRIPVDGEDGELDEDSFSDGGNHSAIAFAAQ